VFERAANSDLEKERLRTLIAKLKVENARLLVELQDLTGQLARARRLLELAKVREAQLELDLDALGDEYEENMEKLVKAGEYREMLEKQVRGTLIAIQHTNGAAEGAAQARSKVVARSPQSECQP
jgi:hypothetical protein